MKIKNLFLTIFFGMLLSTSSAFSLDKLTHEAINTYMASIKIEDFSLTNRLREDLGFKNGVDEKLNKGREAWRWLGSGGRAEDEPDALWRYVFKRARNFNHFHNPVVNWDQAGLAAFPYSSQSLILWAQNPDQNIGDKCSWQDARKYFYQGLTALHNEYRNYYFAYTFLALGQQMHIVQDGSVPSHVRNDIHIFYDYEAYIEKIRNSRDQGERSKYFELLKDPISFDKEILNFDPNKLAPIPIAKIIDADQYTKNNPDVTVTNKVGIAEYTNANFFSEDTIFSNNFNYPAENSGEIVDYFIPDPKDKTILTTRQYFEKKRHGDYGYRLAAVTFLQDYIDEYSPSYSGRVMHYLDDEVYYDYAQRLIPRALGHSAGLLEYFFRGQLDVISVPFFYQNRLYALQLKIKNKTKGENMVDGHFALTYRYTPVGGNPDGSNDVFGWAQSEISLSGPLVSKDEKGQDFVFFMSGDGIPIESLASLRFTLAYQGTLGLEEKAVIGKVFTPGEIKFNEEWDNGLTGNHVWLHTGYSGDNPNDPNAGYQVNMTDQGWLVKENIRYAGQWKGQYNQSFIGVVSTIPDDSHKDAFPIPITKNTYLQFKIAQFSMDPPLPRTWNSCVHEQFMALRFNHGLELQYSLPGQCSCMGSGFGVTIGDRMIPLGYEGVDNIYEAMRQSGIPIPTDGLQLRYIELYQQLWNVGEPSPIEHRQLMEVDFIRIVEGKEHLVPKD